MAMSMEPEQGFLLSQLTAKGRLTAGSTAYANFESPLGFSNPLTRTGNLISLDVPTTSVTTTTASNSGLEIGTDGLRLLGGCSENTRFLLGILGMPMYGSATSRINRYSVQVPEYR